ncbi:GM12899 [Drosophila sechellia]|uniref:GM12899 n=1 Tax=Drosophila sechellia TaxID=7238 RepID=B4HZU2_DROSE|nr:GM12899 [Drosophila sechellia]
MNKLYLYSTADLLLIQPGAVRPALFLFYTLETILNMICIGYHIIGFQPLEWRGQEVHYLCLLTFNVFMVINFFQSIAICTGRVPNVLMEIWKASVAAFAFILISFLTMWDVEQQFSVFFVRSSEQVQGEHKELPPVHPIIRYKTGGSVVGHHQPEALRPVLFLFYTLETIFNMFCMGYHISGFQAIEFHLIEWDTVAIHYFYLVTFYFFMVVTLLQSVNICTGNTPAVVTEIWKSSGAAIVFILISLSTMWDAERQFYVFFFASDIGDKHSHEFVEDRPMHPIFYYLRGMSVSSLTCGILYLLHATIMIDVKLTNDRNQGESKGMPDPIRRTLLLLLLLPQFQLGKTEGISPDPDLRVLRIRGGYGCKGRGKAPRPGPNSG